MNDSKKDRWRCKSCKGEFQRERRKGAPLECDSCGKSSNKTAFEALTGPYKYFDLEGRKEFIPMDLADDIMRDHNFATIEGTDQIYVYEEGVYQKTGDPIIEKEAQKRLRKESRKNRKREVVDYVKTATYTPPDQFNQDERKIVVENGILDLESRELEGHTPEEIHTIKIPVEYDPEADCPEIKEFIKDIVEDDGDLEKIQELLGYTLLKENPLNKAFMGLGNGANGRSTLFRLFERFLGKDNTSSVKLLDLTKNRFASSDLFGKLANFSGETSDGKIKNSHRFKELVGEDEIRAEEKYEKAFKFVNFATPWFASNDLPETNDKTRSFYRRWVIIDFPYTFTSDPDELQLDDHKEKDPSLPESIITDRGLSGLLNWALEGMDRVLENHRFTNERSVNEKSELWETESDPIANFIDSWCIEDEEVVIPQKVLYNAYLRFCKEKQLSHVQLGQFTKKLDRKGFPKSRRGPRGDRLFCYEGLTLEEDKLKEAVSTVSTEIIKTLRKSDGYFDVNKEKVLSEDLDTSDTRQGKLPKKSAEEGKPLKDQILDELRKGDRGLNQLTESVKGYSKEDVKKELERLREEEELIDHNPERGYYLL